MSRNDLDMFNKLDDPVLVAILSSLTFKEATMASVLSKRCLRLWRQQCPNVEFDENLFVDQQTGQKQRRSFIDFAKQYIANYGENINIHKFSLTLSQPEEFLADVKEFVDFSLSLNPKNFSLDFFDLQNQRASSYTLPKQFYEQKLIESLKLFACNFLICKLKNFSLLRELSLGYIGFQRKPKGIQSVLDNCNSLESLILKKCYMHSVIIYSEKLKILVLDENEVSQNFYCIEAKNLKLFKFCGNAGIFESEGIWRSMEEADLDLEPEHEFDNIGHHLYKLMQELYAVKTLKVCSYILQVLPTGEEKFRMESSLNVRHLILKTEIHEREFCGIKFLLGSCPVLEKLTILINPARNLQGYEAPYRIDPTKFWVRNVVVAKCLRRTLKTVEIIGFKATKNELSFMGHLLSLGDSLRQLDLYPSREVADGGNMKMYVHKAQRLQQFALANCKNLNVSIY